MNSSLSSSEFLQNFKKSKSVKLGSLSFRYNKCNIPMLGMSVPRGFGSAVKRNLFKRRCRAVFKLVINDNSINYSIIIFPAKKHISYLDIKTSFELFYDRISF